MYGKHDKISYPLFNLICFYILCLFSFQREMKFALGKLLVEAVPEGSFHHVCVALDTSASMRDHEEVLQRMTTTAIDGGLDVFIYSTTCVRVTEENETAARNLKSMRLGSAYMQNTNYYDTLRQLLAVATPSSRIWIITDGQPNTGGDWHSVRRDLHAILDKTQGGKMKAMFLSDCGEQFKETMNLLDSDGKTTYIDSAGFEEMVRAAFADTLQETVSKEGVLMGSFKVSLLEDQSQCQALREADLPTIIGATAAVILFLEKFPAAVSICDTVRSLNQCLNAFHRSTAYGVPALMNKLRDMAATAGVRDVSAGQINNLLALAGVMNAMTPTPLAEMSELQKELPGLLQCAKIAAANNATKAAKNAHKVRQKTLARRKEIQDRLSSVAGGIESLLLSGYPFHAFPIQISPTLYEQFSDFKQSSDDSNAENYRSRTAALQNPSCVLIRALPSTRLVEGIADHETDQLMFLRASNPKLAAGLLKLLSFQWTNGVATSWAAPFALCGILLQSNYATPLSAWQAYAVLDALKHYLNETTKENPFNVVVAASGGFCYGETLRDGKVAIPNSTVALLAPVLATNGPFSGHPNPPIKQKEEPVADWLADGLEQIGEEVLVQCLMPVLQQALPAEYTKCWPATRPVMRLELPMTPQVVVDALVSGLPVDSLLSTHTVRFSSVSPILAETMELLQQKHYTLEGIVCPVRTPDEIAALVAVVAAVKQGLSPAALSSQNVSFARLQTIPIFTKAFERALWQLYVAHTLAGRKLSNLELADQLLPVQVTDQTVCFTVRSWSKKLTATLLNDYLEVAQFPAELDKLLQLSEVVDTREAIVDWLGGPSAQLITFEKALQVLPLATTTDLRRRLFNRVCLFTVKESPTKAWTKEIMEDFVLSLPLELKEEEVGPGENLSTLQAILSRALCLVRESAAVTRLTALLKLLPVRVVVDMVLQHQAGPSPVIDAMLQVKVVEHLLSLSDEELCMALSRFVLYQPILDAFQSRLLALIDTDVTPGRRHLAATLQTIAVSEQLQKVLDTRYNELPLTLHVRQTITKWAQNIRSPGLAHLDEDVIHEYVTQRLSRGHSWLKKQCKQMTFKQFVAIRMAMEDAQYGDRLRFHNTVMRALPFVTFDGDTVRIPDIIVDDIRKAI
jgi:hypothetical protein